MHKCKKSCTFAPDFVSVMKKTKIIPTLLLCLMMSSCQLWDRPVQSGVAVELNGRYITQATLDSLTLGLSSEDSMRVAQQYISQWAKELLIYDEAMRGGMLNDRRDNPDIETLVEDYRRALYVHAYEERLVEQQMPKTILDSTIMQYYNAMPDRFRLEESIVKGILVVMPTDAPNAKKIRAWLAEVQPAKNDNKIIDHIEKYAYQYADGYELFADRWLTTSDLLMHMPIERAELENRLKQRSQIEIADSVNTYLLQVLDKHIRGEQMPIDYARPQIERMILTSRQVEFLRKKREQLYDEALQTGKLKIAHDE